VPALTSVAIRELAEFVHRTGDLYEPGGRVTAEEGVTGQARWQKGRPASYQRERSVLGEVNCSDIVLTLRGRADGIDLEAGLIEEIKTSRRFPETPSSEHVAQGRLYAALLAREFPARTAWTVQVTYVNPDSLESRAFTEDLSCVSLEAFLRESVDVYARWLADRLRDRALRDGWLSELKFPLPQLRPYQGAVIRRCADAIRSAEHLLLEAPTGSGKTLSVTFPAVKALPGASRIFYLTSRSTGATAALTALRQLDGNDGQLRRLSLTARDRICPVPGTPCDPTVCDYARGYYDRRRPALVELLAERELTAPVISRVAMTHTVCPFELSLDAAVWVDVVIGDYNYLFDPLVRLQRFAADKDAIVLVDEAHQLAPRVVESLSITITRYDFKVAIGLAAAPIAKRLRSVDRLLLKLSKNLPFESSEQQSVEVAPTLMSDLEKLLGKLLESAVQWQNDTAQALPHEVSEAVFLAVRWLRLQPSMAICAYGYFASDRGQNFKLEARCLDPAPYLHRLLSGFGPHIRFSATVSPPRIYQRQHGALLQAGVEGDEGVFARAGSPFSASQLGVFIVPDVGTRYRERGSGMTALVTLVRDTILVRPGRYLVCFPSYQYLRDFCTFFEPEIAAREDWTFRCQQSGDQAEQRLEMMAELQSSLAADAGVLLGIVMGGVFAESIDLSSSPLDGVIIVGVAIPPPSAERELAAAHFDADGFDGRLLAYIQPGMSRIVQAAGRLIRARSHRGILILVDGRYRAAQYRQFFPALWNTRTVVSTQLNSAVKEFWTTS
jgi:DNA excision repair protein ERCC-2